MSQGFIYNSSIPSGPAGGDLSGSYPNPLVVSVDGIPFNVSNVTSGNIIVADGTHWNSVVPSGTIVITPSGSIYLSNTGVAPGTYGTSTTVPVITVGSDGRITSITQIAISGLVVNASGVSFNNAGTDYTATNVQNALVEVDKWLNGTELFPNTIDIKANNGITLDTSTGSGSTVLTLNANNGVIKWTGGAFQLRKSDLSSPIGAIYSDNTAAPTTYEIQSSSGIDMIVAGGDGLQLDLNHTTDSFNFTGDGSASINAGSMKITNLKDATNPQDAVAFSQLPTGLPPSGNAGGDLAGTYPNPTVAKIDGQLLKGINSNTTNILIADGTGYNSFAMSGAGTLSSHALLTLTPTSVTPGFYGTASTVPSFQVNSAGQLIGASGITIVIPGSNVTFNNVGTDYSATTVQTALYEVDNWLNGKELFPNKISLSGNNKVYITDGYLDQIYMDDAGTIFLKPNPAGANTVDVNGAIINNTPQIVGASTLLIQNTSNDAAISLDDNGGGSGTVQIYTGQLELDIDDHTNAFQFYPSSSGTVINVNSQKIVNLLNATNPQDAVAFNQISGGVSPSGNAGGDLSGKYPSPSVSKINGNSLGVTTPTSSNILVADGTKWNSVIPSGVLHITPSGSTYLSPTGVSGNQYGLYNQVPQYTVAADGRLTASSNILIANIPVVYSSGYAAFGDSISTITANGASPVSAGYVQLITNDSKATLIDYAIGGDQCADVADLQVFPNENPTNTFSPLYTLMIGTNDANTKGAGNYETGVFNPCHQAILAWLSIPYQFKTFGQNTSNIQTGTWVNDNTYQTGIGLKSTTNASTLAIPITTYGGPIYIWYRVIDSNGGTFNYNIDGGSNTSASTATTPAIATQNGGTQGVALIRIPNIAAGSHTVNISVTSTTSGSNTVSIIGVGTVPSIINYLSPKVYVGGVIRQMNDTSATATAAYNADVKANASLLLADGLQTYFVDVRNYVNSTVDMSGAVAAGLHPNNYGHSHLRDAFEGTMQFIPNQVQSTVFNAALTINSSTPTNVLGYTRVNATNINNASALDQGILLYGDGSTNNFGIDLGYNPTSGRARTRIFFGGGNDISLSYVTSTGAPASQTDFTDYVVLNNSGMLGIGTLTPGKTLDVKGDIRYSTKLYADINTSGNVLVANGTFYNSVPLTGDITINGSGMSEVLGLRNIAINSVPPTDGQVLTYVAASGNLKYKTLSATGSSIAPTQQIFTSGTGTYVLPSGVLYINVEMVGAGGGGSGSSTVTASNGGNGGNGGNTTFGTSLLSATGGSGGPGGSGGTGGAGGTASLGSGPTGKALSGGSGNSGGSIVSGASGTSSGGAPSALGGGGGGGAIGDGTGLAAANNTGAGGGGAGGTNNASGFITGTGGGAGGYINAIINAPSSTYSFAIGAAGAAGTAGTSGAAGGAGGSGIIIVTEYYTIGSNPGGPTGTAGGDLTNAYPNPTVNAVRGNAASLCVPNVVMIGKSLGGGVSVTTTYVGTTLTVTHSSHGYTTGDWINLFVATNGTSVNQLMQITVTASNTYTCVCSAISGTVSSSAEYFWFNGTRSLNLNLVKECERLGAGDYRFTFTNTQANAWYGISGALGSTGNQCVFNLTQGVPSTTTQLFFRGVNGGGNQEADQYMCLQLTGII